MRMSLDINCILADAPALGDRPHRCDQGLFKQAAHPRGDTRCFSAAHDGPELALVCFDLEDPGSATCALIRETGHRAQGTGKPWPGARRGRVRGSWVVDRAGKRPQREGNVRVAALPPKPVARVRGLREQCSGTSTRRHQLAPRGRMRQTRGIAGGRGRRASRAAIGAREGPPRARSRRPPRKKVTRWYLVRVRVSPEVERRILDYALEKPTHGAPRVSNGPRLQWTLPKERIC